MMMMMMMMWKKKNRNVHPGVDEGVVRGGECLLLRWEVSWKDLRLVSRR